MWGLILVAIAVYLLIAISEGGLPALGEYAFRRKPEAKFTLGQRIGQVFFCVIVLGVLVFLFKAAYFPP